MQDQDLTGANLDSFFGGTDFQGADLRGAHVWSVDNPRGNNTITSYGIIDGLRLSAGQHLFVRDYDGGFPYSIRVSKTAQLDVGGKLLIIFQDKTWGSTITFDPGIPVNLGGDLDLTLASGTELGPLIGHSFQLFDWTGVNPIGRFNVVSDLTWDTSKLYTTGSVMLLPEPNAVLVALGSMLFFRRRRR